MLLPILEISRMSFHYQKQLMLEKDEIKSDDARCDRIPTSSMTSDPNGQVRPSVFSENYPPAAITTFDWNGFPGPSQVHYDNYSMHQNPGFNMHPQMGMNWPNFQFSGHQPTMGHTVQFPFPNAQFNHDIERPMSSFRCKRKTESPPLQPSKQLITEEKMSETLSNLHISSETPADMESEQVKEQRLYMCEEMKKFQANTDPIIPESLLSSMNRPCTALVLWKPPSSILAPSLYNEDLEEEESENNNNSSTRDNNPTNIVINDMEFEDL